LSGSCQVNDQLLYEVHVFYNKESVFLDEKKKIINTERADVVNFNVLIDQLNKPKDRKLIV
jgi:hypothetical protein